MRPIRVWFYGDYACPFSYLGWERLERLCRERALRVVWRPLELRPDLPPDGIRVARPEEIFGGEEGAGRRWTEAARALGLPHDPPSFLPNTRLALESAEFARDLGDAAFRALHEGLFAAYFARGADLGDRETLLALASDRGIDREGLEAALEDRRYEAELQRAEEEALRYGVEGTPTLLFDRFMVVGAAPLADLRRAAERAAAEIGRDGSSGPVEEERAEGTPDRG